MELLIVDDNKAVRDYLRDVLIREGHKCKSASDGNEAVELFRKNEIDCVLLDFEMPGMDGISAAREMLNINPDASIVMVTGFEDMEIIRSTMRLGVFDYLIKPIEPRVLIRVISKVGERNTLLKLKREYHNMLETKVNEQRKKLEEMMFATVKSLVKALEARDPYTSGHSRQVKEIALKLLDGTTHSKEDREVLGSAALVHDVGKVGVPDSILLKPGPLTKYEYDEVKKHPEIGADILRPSVSDDRIIDVVRHHHERHDGNGFPDGLKGDEIPEFTRIIIISDALSAMLSERPYREKRNRNYILKELEENSGAQFDPEFLRITVKLFKKGKIT
jgi:putative two-component system response regulator